MLNVDQPVIVLAGPTAGGKTETAVLLAETLRGEIVSADSMQIYKGMDIGTAKATQAQREKVVHHLIDIIDPGQNYSVADYKRDATSKLRDILARGRQPILCGGTGQYLSAIIDGLKFSEHAPDPALRSSLAAEADLLGMDAMYERLTLTDPETAVRLNPSDRKRIIRALEIHLQTGLTLSEHNRRSRLTGPDFSFKIFGLSHDRPVLYDRINKRVDDMLAAGLADEVRRLLELCPEPESTCLQAIGYKEMIPCIRGERSMSTTADAIRQASRRYAKRQMTWFRKIGGIFWIYNQTPAGNVKIILENI